MMRIKSPIDRSIRFANRVQDHIITTYFQPNAKTALYWSFAFVFFYYGIQKPAPGYSPVRRPVGLFVSNLGIPIDSAILFIGVFEMTLGLLFFMRKFRLVFWMFLAHQIVAFSTLIVMPYYAWQPPWLFLFGIPLPFKMDSWAAFVLKNVVFIGAFIALCHLEYEDRG